LCNIYSYYEGAMALTVRLGPKTERALNALARRKRLSRSDVVREALIRYGAEEGMDAREDGTR
jgi:predicted transcriptional regulator